MNSFEELPVSTSTYMVFYNKETNLDLPYLFQNLPVINSEEEVKKIPKIDQEGVIMNMRFGKEQRGLKVQFKRNFPNQITLNISLKHKYINCFLFKNKIEVRGVREKTDLYDTLLHVHNLFKSISYQVPTIIKIESLMINLNYKFPFKVNKENLSKFLRQNGYHSYFDPQFDNGANIKIPNKTNDGSQTIIVFQSGNVMHSGRTLSEMKEVYEKLFPLVLANEDKVKLQFRLD